MSLSMYDASVTVFLHNLQQLSHMLEKGRAHAEAAGLDPATLTQARLAPDMFPLTRQIQSASDASKLGVARLAAIEAPPFADVEESFAELQDRIARTRAFLQDVPKAAFEGSEERAVVLKTPRGEMKFDGQGYLLHFALPNFFFHVTTAYAILRNQGVPLGKMDFLGRA
ncbi:MAG: DUF1993 domain-containing protein [Comamonadaceae bacterium]|nr:MAG: DUF1993 domain-containing protein [Comamonadaceae bacterium]